VVCCLESVRGRCSCILWTSYIYTHFGSSHEPNSSGALKPPYTFEMCINDRFRSAVSERAMNPWPPISHSFSTEALRLSKTNNKVFVDGGNEKSFKNPRTPLKQYLRLTALGKLIRISQGSSSATDALLTELREQFRRSAVIYTMHHVE